MTDPTPMSETDLAREALLYLTNELDGLRLEAFERRLETDPAAQLQLSQTVELTRLLTSQSTRPNPAYRDQVRKKLVRLPRSVKWTSIRLACELALLASVILAVWILDQVSFSEEIQPIPTHRQIVERNDPSLPLRDEEELVQATQMAEAWAEMSNLDHYQKNDDEETRRRNRPREAGQLTLQSFMEEHGGSFD